MSDYNLPRELRYSASDEWVNVSDDLITIGVSDYAQQQLGDIVFVELPEVGAVLKKDAAFGVIESVKAVSDLYAPVSGTVTAINTELAEHPERVNEDCYGAGWLLQLRSATPGELAELFDAEAYRADISERST